jgi:hypothetical protein
VDRSGLAGDVGDRLRALEQRVEQQQQDLRQVHDRIDRIESRADGAGRAALVERTASDTPAAPPPAVPAVAATTGPEILEGRLLTIWNALDWEQGKPPLSAIEDLLRDEGYDFIDGIVGTYALAVPRRPGDDPDAPVYLLPFLGKANAHYDDSLFERPPHGDSQRVSAVAKLRFVERGGLREVLLERLRAGNAKLSQVLTVVAPGRIE